MRLLRRSAVPAVLAVLSLLSACRLNFPMGITPKRGTERMKLEVDLRTPDSTHLGYARLMRYCQSVSEALRLSIDGSNRQRVGRVKQVAMVGAAIAGTAEIVAGIMEEEGHKAASIWLAAGGAVVGFVSAAILAFIDSEDTSTPTKQARILKIDDARTALGRYLAEIHEKAPQIGEPQHQSALSLLFQNAALACDIDLEAYTSKKPPRATPVDMPAAMPAAPPAATPAAPPAATP